MLCDTMMGQWADPAKAPTFEPEVERLMKLAGEGGHEAEIKSANLNLGRLHQVKAALTEWMVHAPHLSEVAGIKFDELATFRDMLRSAQKFYISPEFASASLANFATPETMVSARDWFRLTHDPMWLEWHYDDRPGLRLGALFYTRSAREGLPEFYCYIVLGVKGDGDIPGYQLFKILHYRLRPDTARLEGGHFRMEIEELCDNPQNFEGFNLALVAYDFIVRINSPKITEFRPCEDLTLLNRKRARQGKLPLCSYQIVDLNKTIKHDLRLADSEGEGGMRFHWRRGHFKLLSGPRYKEPGLHWWNPHTAGRKVNGEIKKEYVA
ncbi:MAG: hypothetical protein U0835_00460 [Isosphaeraceae bacterium]